VDVTVKTNEIACVSISVTIKGVKEVADTTDTSVEVEVNVVGEMMTSVSSTVLG